MDVSEEAVSFKNIKDQYGRESQKLVRDFESFTKKKARFHIETVCCCSPCGCLVESRAVIL